jgi:hypothetical protein
MKRGITKISISLLRIYIYDLLHCIGACSINYKLVISINFNKASHSLKIIKSIAEHAFLSLKCMLRGRLEFNYEDGFFC